MATRCRSPRAKGAPSVVTDQSGPRFFRSRTKMDMLRLARTVSLALLLAALAQSARLLAEPNWPAWGGPTGTSHTEETGLPLSWSADNILWKADLAGDGQSTPVTWGDRIFLTTALEKGRQRVVFAIDRRDGKMLWQQTAWTGEPEPSHVMNGWASASCATNGKVVGAFFGRGGLHAYAPAGKHLWSRDLGQFDG